MPNRITNITLPSPVTAGADVDVTIDYVADDDGDLTIRYLGSFDGHPSTVSLEAAGGRKTFPLAIVRYGSASLCRIAFQFGNRKVCLVEVL
jgi:hypothetical protein